MSKLEGSKTNQKTKVEQLKA
jgi:ATP-binding cassette subfamily B (MDR/TAP) protein 1